MHTMTIVKLDLKDAKDISHNVKDIPAGSYFRQDLSCTNTVYLKTQEDSGIVVYCVDGVSMGQIYPSKSFGAGWNIIGNVTLTVTN